MGFHFPKLIAFLGIDDDTSRTLLAFRDLAEPQMDSIMDAVYAHIRSHPEAAAVFTSETEVARARAAQKSHWLTHVLAGRFDADYERATIRIGQAHFRRGVNLLIYVGTYSVVLDRLVDVIATALPDDARLRRRYVNALTKAVFLDMGLSTSVYYESEISQVQELSVELNASLARAGEYRDNETGRHITRMSRMCGILARAIGQGDDWVRMLVAASPLHDVGKIGIPDNILLKPGRLTPGELEVMRRHPLIGGDIIPNHPAEVVRMARRISLTHHEKWDGSGYPTGLRREEIPLEGRIAAICDVFDALMSRRPYKEPWPLDRVVQYLRDNAGHQFDPALVEAFMTVLPEMLRIQADFAETDTADAPATDAAVADRR